jgi:hypothetical protein
VLVATGAAAAGLGVVAAWRLGAVAVHWAEHGLPGRTVARLRQPHGPMLQVRRQHLRRTRLVRGSDGQLALELAHADGTSRLEGAEARHAASVLFPSVNQFGGTRDEVQRAVRRLEHAGGSEQYLGRIAGSGEKLTPVVEWERDWMGESGYDEEESGLLALPVSVRLAIEMALHEERERRALEGELHELERAWREAEEIAAISDSLLVPQWIEDRIKRMR